MKVSLVDAARAMGERRQIAYETTVPPELQRRDVVAGSADPDDARRVWVGLELDPDEVDQVSTRFVIELLASLRALGLFYADVIATTAWVDGLATGVLLEQMRQRADRVQA